MNQPLISVLVPTRDRAALLSDALESLAHQDLPRDRFEVVVVDDGSTDQTATVVAAFETLLCIRYAYQENAGLASAKNHAIRIASAPIVLFMDDDDVGQEDLLSQHLQMHDERPGEHVAVLGFTGLAGEAAQSPLMFFLTEVGCYLYCYPKIRHGQVLGYAYFWGGRTSCKRSFLLKRGLFDPQFRFGCEDIELGYRLAAHGLQVVYNSKARSSMMRAISVEQFCRRSEQQGYSSWLFYRKHPLPDVGSWADVSDLDARWAYFEPRLCSLLKSALDLDGIAATRRKHGLEADELLLSLLHKAYWSVIDGHRVRGAWMASKGFARP